VSSAPIAPSAALPPKPASAFRNRDFTKLWSAATISLLGTQISQIAIPAIAVLLLHVSPFEVALLGTVEFLPFLLFTLPAGVWVDRLPRRRILISGDLGRALMLATIPIAWFSGVLTIWQLYVVGFVNGLLTVFFDIADQSYLPTVLERDQLVDGNAKLQASSSIAQIIGQPLGGGIIGLLTAPVAVALDAISYVASALLVFAIRRPERASRARSSAAAVSAEETADAPEAGASVAAEVSVDRQAAGADVGRASVRQEVTEGLRFVTRHRYLRNIAATTGLSNLFGNIVFAIYPIYAYVNLGLTPEQVGLAGGGFGLGAFVGAFTANRIAERIGVGPTIVASIALAAPSGLLIAIATHETAVLFLAASGFIGSWGAVVYNVNQVSLRQAITPEPLLGRMNATMRFLVWGTIPIGQIIGGTLATVTSTQTAVWIGALASLVSFVPVALSPVRSLQRIPSPEEAAEAAEAAA
jgi:MFS family permease